MLEYLFLLPMVIISILTMTLQVSFDELSNASSGNLFQYGRHDIDAHVQNKVHELLTRMLEDTENNINGSLSKRGKNRRPNLLQGQACDIWKIQSMHRQCLCRKPSKRCVKIVPPKNNVISVMPECVMVDRCEGVCPSSTTCLPTSVDIITLPVIFLNLVVTDGGDTDVMTDCSTIEVEKHLKCGCNCALTKEDCNQNQVFNPAMCRCECSGISRAEKCNNENKFWDASICDCICPLDVPQICSTGAFFHKGLCRCVPIEDSNREIYGRRRRPPPV